MLTKYIQECGAGDLLSWVSCTDSSSLDVWNVIWGLPNTSPWYRWSAFLSRFPQHRSVVARQQPRQMGTCDRVSRVCNANEVLCIVVYLCVCCAIYCRGHLDDIASYTSKWVHESCDLLILRLRERWLYEPHVHDSIKVETGMHWTIYLWSVADQTLATKHNESTMEGIKRQK